MIMAAARSDGSPGSHTFARQLAPRDFALARTKESVQMFCDPADEALAIRTTLSLAIRAGHVPDRVLWEAAAPRGDRFLIRAARFQALDDVKGRIRAPVSA
jgi:hypothetical protein